MPVNKHLEWFELREFGGLWTAGASLLMPPDRAQVMSGCHPQPGGGLRAFLRPARSIDGANMTQGDYDLDNEMVGFGIVTKADAGDTSDVTLFAVTINGQYYFDLTDGGGYATTPDHAGYDITGDLDLRIYCAADDWSPTTNQRLIDKAVVNASGYRLVLTTTGALNLIWGTGAAEITRTSTATLSALSNGTRKWVRATLDVDDGAGNHVVNFYTSDDGNTWSALGSAITTAGTTSIATNNVDLRIGADSGGGSRFDGKVFAAEVRNGIAGTRVAAPDFTTIRPDESSFTDARGNVWTLVTNRTTKDTVGMQDWQLWRREMDEPGSWVRTTSGNFVGEQQLYLTPPPTQPRFARMYDSGTSDSEIFVSLSIRDDGVPGASGLYRVSPESGAVVRNAAFSDSYGAVGVVEHQARLVAGYKDQIKFSAPNTSDFSAAGSGFITLSPEGWEFSAVVNEGPLIAWMVSVPPGDLIVATRNGRIYNVQGDLADPTVRELGRWTTALTHEPVNTPKGVFFILPNQGVARLGLDGSAELVSQGILPSIWNLTEPEVGLGQLAGTERYVFCPNQHKTTEHKNGALVYDADTGAWFTSTHSDDYPIANPKFMQADNNPRSSGIWVCAGRIPKDAGEGGDITEFIFQFQTGGVDGASLTTELRNPTWEWKSAPLRSPDGRRVRIREVQIATHAFNSNTSTLAVTVNGTTVTRTLAAGRQVETFLFDQRAETLDVTVKAKSNDAAIEAPIMEAIRVGWQPEHML